MKVAGVKAGFCSFSVQSGGTVMGDSDDEYDRKRRDKFRGERGEASYRGTERPARPRDDWVER